MRSKCDGDTSPVVARSFERVGMTAQTSQCLGCYIFPWFPNRVIEESSHIFFKTKKSTSFLAEGSKLPHQTSVFHGIPLRA